MKKIITSLVLSSLLAPVHSKVTITDIQSAISCNSGISTRHWFKALTDTFGKHDYVEGGAAWFKVSEEMYGLKTSHVFVSITKYHHFVGVLFKDPPDKLAQAIKTSRSFPTNVFETNGHWVGADSRLIMWHKQKHAKVFCAGLGNM
jgi:hypothetical protein